MNIEDMDLEKFWDDFPYKTTYLGTIDYAAWIEYCGGDWDFAGDLFIIYQELGLASDGTTLNEN